MTSENAPTATAPPRRWAPRLTALESRRGATIALALLLATHFALNLLWLRLDNHVVRIDEEFHASAAQDYFYAVKNPALHGFRERLDAMLAIDSPYPPLLHVLGGLSALLFGYCNDTVALPSTIYFGLVILGAYFVARRIYPRPEAVLAATLTGFIPVLFAGSRYIALENLISVFSIWGLFFLLRSDGFRSWPYVLAFSVINGLAISTKPNAFVYYLAPAVAVFAFGLLRAFKSPGRREVFRIVGYGLASVSITAAMALPWYLYHREELTRYWLTEHKGGKTPFAFTHVEGMPEEPGKKLLLEDRVTNPALGHSHAAPSAPAIAATPAEPTTDTPIPQPERKVSLEPGGLFWGREWAAYPIMIVNNGAFLPLTLAGLAGLMAGAFRFRQRRDFWLILAWFLGSYALNTMLFRFINPRYAMPFIAALGIGAAGLPRLLPWRWARVGLAISMLALLGAQYLNVSFIGSKRINTWLPVLADHFRVKYFLDHGLTVTKAEVITGTYCFCAPARGENYVDRGFRVMAEVERELGRGVEREVNYVSVARQNNFGGFRNVEACYWPEPNPLLLRRLRGKPELQAKFSRILRCNTPEEAAAATNDADYIVAILDVTEATIDEGPSHIFFDDIRRLTHMELRDFFFTPPYGLLPGGMIGIFARTHNDFYGHIPDLRGKEATVSEDDLAVNAVRLLTMRNPDGTPRVLTDAQQAEREERLKALFPLLKPTMNLSPNIDLVRVVFDQPYAGWYRVRLLFHVLAQPDADWRIFVTGKFRPEDVHLVPEKVREQKMFAWNFSPTPPTSQWRPGEFVLCSREFTCPPIPIDLSIGFFRNGHQGSGRAIDAQIDFGNFPVNDQFAPN